MRRLPLALLLPPSPRKTLSLWISSGSGWRFLAREHKLTPRETEVFGLLAHGRSIPYVRDALIISRDTAATHAKHIYAKLDVHSRQELIDLVMSNEL